MLFFVLSYIAYSADQLNMNLGAYADTYLTMDSDYLPNPWELQDVKFVQRPYTYINPKKNQFDLNIVQLTANMDYANFVHGKITIQHGTLVETAYGGFPVQEAYIGIQPIKGLWIDAGYYLTHIGGESFLPKDNWLSSHSIVTYFEPFYHAGVKAYYSSGSLVAGLHYCNGNGILQDNNKDKSIGAFLSYQLSDTYSISYASIFGNEESGSDESKIHQLHNICFNGKPLSNLEFKLQGDVSMKENVNSDANNLYYGLTAQLRYTITEKIKTTFRYSTFDDQENVYATGLKGMETTIGFEYAPFTNSYFRIEGGMLNFTTGDLNLDNKFTNKDGTKTDSRLNLSLNFGIWL